AGLSPSPSLEKGIMVIAPRRAPDLPTRLLSLAALLAVTACTDAATSPRAVAPLTPAANADMVQGTATTVSYDAKSLAEYQSKWSNIYGPLELAAGGTLRVNSTGNVNVRAVPFHVGADFSVYDHLKYIAISNQSFAVPANGSLMFSVRITASTPGTQAGRVIRGCYGGPFSYASVADPCAQPWSAVAMEGQQAGVVLNMINFATGQLFDWFISENKAFALVERLPSNVTGSGNVGLDKAYTQIVREATITPGKKYDVAIRYTRGAGVSRVEFFLNGALFASTDNVGIPLDVQGVPYTGVYPSYGPGEALASQLDSFVIGHGLFSLLDAYPFQHPDRPDLSVSIPMSERLFGQGADGTWEKFTVTTQPR
ncbi:MAG TPA: DUF6081 family protein, partial [Gemmatimonadaceae bacterium]|nr:DUF6081 family protein [Gemmatimonadaceae bacterium]